MGQVQAKLTRDYFRNHFRLHIRAVEKAKNRIG